MIHVACCTPIHGNYMCFRTRIDICMRRFGVCVCVCVCVCVQLWGFDVFAKAVGMKEQIVVIENTSTPRHIMACFRIKIYRD